MYIVISCVKIFLLVSKYLSLWSWLVGIGHYRGHLYFTNTSCLLCFITLFYFWNLKGNQWIFLIACCLSLFCPPKGISCFLFCFLVCYGLTSVVVHCLSCINILSCHALTSSRELLGQSLPNLVCSICRVRRHRIVMYENKSSSIKKSM